VLNTSTECGANVTARPGFLLLLSLSALVFSCQAPAGDTPLEASGVIRADEIRIASEFQGYVSQLLVQAGDNVIQGQALLVLDSTSLLAAMHEAQSDVATAEAELQRVLAGPRAEQVSVRRSQVAAAGAGTEMARVIWQAAVRAVEEPYQLQQRILQAEGQVTLAAQGVESAAAAQAKARAQADDAEWGSPQRQALELQAAAADAALAAAHVDERLAQDILQRLQAMREQPISLLSQAHEAEGAYRVAEARAQIAQVELDDLLAGTTAAEAAVARGNLELAQARRALAQLQLERLTLRAPVSATVLSTMANVGEAALPGVTLLAIADLAQVELVVYLPVTELGQLHLSQSVDVLVDSFGDRVFSGQVAHIADEPQYTPRNVATRDERINTVYAITIRVPNPDRALKAGMTADARFVPEN